MSPVLEALLRGIPPEARKKIIEGAGKRITERGGRKFLRLQYFIPEELYTLLSYYGALDDGEGLFFVQRAREYLERRALEMPPDLEKRHRGGR